MNPYDYVQYLFISKKHELKNYEHFKPFPSTICMFMLEHINILILFIIQNI